MAGLVGYASSDEDEEVEQPQRIQVCSLAVELMKPCTTDTPVASW
jgi:hypothetical protein